MPTQAPPAGPRRLEVTATVVVERRDPESVWQFMRRPENAVGIQDGLVRAYSVPGTGPGPGEMLVYETLQEGKRSTYVLTVSEERYAEYFAVTGDLRVSDELNMSIGQVWQVQPVLDGTRATTTAWFNLPGQP